MLVLSPSADGPPVIPHYDISDTNSDSEVVNVDNLLAAAVVQEHSNSLGNQDSGSAWRTRGLLDELSGDTGLFKFFSSDIFSSISVGVSPFPAFSIFIVYEAWKAACADFAVKQYRYLLKMPDIYSKIQMIKIDKGCCNVLPT